MHILSTHKTFKGEASMTGKEVILTLKDGKVREGIRIFKE